MKKDLQRGIPLSTCFNLMAPMPLDPRLIVQNRSELLKLDKDILYPGMYVYLLDEDIQYKIDKDGQWKVSNAGFCSGEGVPIESIGKIGEMYIDKLSGDVFFKVITDYVNLTATWEYVMNMKGIKGDQGIQGPIGTRGSLWFCGVAINGEDPNPKTFPSSGLINVLSNDLYFNTVTGNIYVCVTSGNSDVATWGYRNTIKGQQGEQGIQGEKGMIGPIGPIGETGEKGDPGPFVYFGNQLTGDTPDEGKLFPLAVDDNNYVKSDLYLSTLSGEMYRCLSGGKINEILWIKVTAIFGNRIYTGTVIYESIGGPFIANTGIRYANIGDCYFNSSVGYWYTCITPGNDSVAEWEFRDTIRGPKGDRGMDIYLFDNLSITVDRWVSVSDSTRYGVYLTFPDIPDVGIDGHLKTIDVEFFPELSQVTIDQILDCNITTTQVKKPDDKNVYVQFYADVKPTDTINFTIKIYSY